MDSELPDLQSTWNRWKYLRLSYLNRKAAKETMSDDYLVELTSSMEHCAHDICVIPPKSSSDLETKLWAALSIKLLESEHEVHAINQNTSYFNEFSPKLGSSEKIIVSILSSHLIQSSTAR